MIKVLVVEDSEVSRTLLVGMLESDPEIEVVGVAGNGVEALEFLKWEKPDVITMDIFMPKMDGYETTKTIMETDPVPIVIISGTMSQVDVGKAFRAIEAGALTIIEKPLGPKSGDFEALRERIVKTVKSMSEVKVVRRRPKATPTAPVRVPAPDEAIEKRKVEVVAIGASAGGPQALKEVLSGLNRTLTVPTLVVQHIAPGFIDGLASWLTKDTGLPCVVAGGGDRMLPGRVYFAPDGVQMGVTRGGSISLAGGCKQNGMCPSVSHLFSSVADVFGPSAVGVILTGMGKDGAAELGLMKERGAFTIAQDEASSVVGGMPGEAARLDAATTVLPLDSIAIALKRLLPVERYAPGKTKQGTENTLDRN